MPTLYKKPKVSIVLPVFNGEKTLSACLDSLMILDFSKEDREVIVVDNNSTDGTKAIIQKYPVTYIFEKKKGRGCARNTQLTDTGVALNRGGGHPTAFIVLRMV